MAHLSKFVEKSRQELRGLWDQCYYGQEQRNAFRPMCSTDYNEEMLDAHEILRLEHPKKNNVWETPDLQNSNLDLDDMTEPSMYIFFLNPKLTLHELFV